MNANWIERCKKLPVSALVDAMNGYGAVDTSIAPLEKAAVFCGPAEPVWTMPGNDAWADALLTDLLPGSVIVVDAGGETGLASASSAVCAQLQAAGAIGIAVDGSVTRYACSCFPVFAKDVHPRMLEQSDAFRLGKAVCLGGVPVHRGDLVYGTEDGVVVVPSAEADYVLIKAETLAGN